MFKASSYKETSAKVLFFVCAGLSVVAVFGIIGFILYASIPAFRQIGFFNFLFGTVWAPDLFNMGLADASDVFGILPMIVNSLLVTIGAIVIGGTIGVFTAIFLVFWCPDKFHLRYKGENKFLQKVVSLINKINLRTVFDQIIKLLAGIPSLVCGFFALEIIVPMLAAMNPEGVGQGLLACFLILAIMILPTITSLTKNALEAVPQQYYEGALAMGNTKAQAVFRVVFPAARSGIISALILGVGRAVGEAMAVIWVCGNRADFPDGLFSYIRTLTTNIVMEMGYASSAVHKPALIATGLVLLIIVLLINLSMNLVPKEFKGKRGEKVLRGEETVVIYKKKGLIPEILKYVAIVFAALVAVILALIVGFILVRGLGGLSWDFLFGEASNGHPTLAPSFAVTGYIILFTLIIALPLGIGAAIYLVEYAKPGSKVVKVLRTFIDTLSGVPSIVFGLFGMIFFGEILGLGYSVLTGSFTMVLVVLPTIIRSTEEALLAVPMPLREASYGLGASKVRTIFKVVLPSAFPGIATAAVLSIGRIIGESAALIFTVGSILTFGGSPLDQGSTLAVLLYTLSVEGLEKELSYATAAVLLILTFLLNMIVYFIERKVKKRNK